MVIPRKAVLSTLLLLASGSALGAEFRPGQIIVKYKENGLRARSAMNALYDSVGVNQVQRFSGTMKGFEQLNIDPSADVLAVVKELQENDLVEYAQPDYILRSLPIALAEETAEVSPMEDCWFPGIPYPPGCGEAAGPTGRPELKDAPSEVMPAKADPDISKLYGLAKIDAEKAWAIHRGSKSFIVADIDTGIDYNHEDLAFNVWRNPDPSDKKDVVGFDFIHNDGLPFDDNKHGTHTAGTIGAVGGNGIGISGVSQVVSLMAIKFLSAKGQGTTSDAIRSIDYAVQHGAKVLSNSWGGPSDKDNPALRDAIERARLKDVLFIAAAGNDTKDNDGASASYPAAFNNDNLIAVAATDSSDKLAYFSNYGKKTTHLAAPGAGIVSTVPGNKYASLSGTSMACPHVAGAAALVWSAHPNWNYKKVKEVLMSTVDRLPGLTDKTITGGRINVANALAVTE